MVNSLFTHFKNLVEFPFFLVSFAHMFADTINTNLIIYRTCYVTLNYNESDCALLGTSYSDDAIADLEKKVQPHATNIFTTNAVIQATFPPIVCFFFGPWSDMYGRKPLLLLATAGCGIAYLIVLIISAVPFASPWFLLLYSMPSCLFGGITSLITAVLCYIIDMTSEENRGVRMGLFEGVLVLGTVLGTSSSSFVLNSYGYVTVYAICGGCAIISWLFTFIVISESVANVKSEDKLRNLFKLSLVKAGITTTIKKRKYNERTMILINILIIVLAMFATYGNKGVIFLFLRLQFQWTLQKFTLYTSFSDAVGIAGTIVGTFVLHKLLRIRETIVILFGVISALSSALLQGLANHDWQIYVAGTIRCLSNAISPMARCRISKLIPVEDSGKVFSLLTAFETMCALIGVTVYTNIYNSTLTSYPEAFNFVTFGIYVFEIILLITVCIAQKFYDKMAHEDLQKQLKNINM